ncbi:hypothetical protein MPTK1_5g08700 [Marchantia polymorpha subsp. ruderalis]|uniref:Uncharacterized protein n=2 Tax=Marchantia polymorpha TaxID=3197 RepID=A0AAF6BGC7_MARPO|nr:hypothetical protein MARPO_0086s0074 [Marchantia polymorpha]BBN11058.1 hypothetical protein Mp_5g08700 [Marchantia polymorpha subsp. ruderalis]PTQ33757.1 hypothetical protein MARPO_0086s0074 [Marchantia polymorpha]PTQ33758.1 hypothetical protein MARPO_0086s0074 [Marchantia polymorpha]PTQ33759.1 hypothetical protein MARPO_0086s0074 [Marchantia polymorpha]|eukprot:PTQ33756.1 hypothetical protein MARPO_0086s0074 [Marchantia polymorpha]
MAARVRTLACHVAVMILVAAADCAYGEDNVFLVNAKKVYLRNCGDSDSFCSPSTDCETDCCCDIIAPIPINTEVEVQCRAKGQKVSRDPWWLYVYVPSIDEFGWVADFFVECGPRICPALRC